VLINDIIIVEHTRGIQVIRTRLIIFANSKSIYIKDALVKPLVLYLRKRWPSATLKSALSKKVRLKDADFPQYGYVSILENRFGKHPRLDPHYACSFGDFISHIRIHTNGSSHMLVNFDKSEKDIGHLRLYFNIHVGVLTQIDSSTPGTHPPKFDDPF